VAAVSFHFRSKEHLYIETVRHAAESCARHSPIPNWPEGVPAERRLRDFITALLGRFLRPDVPEWHRLLIFREVAEPRPGACERFAEEFVRPTHQALLGVLRDLLPGAERHELILVANSIIGQCLHYHHARHVLALLLGQKECDRFDADRLTEHIWRFSLAAIRSLYPGPDKGDRA
jgi:AcrR family transcriptional regulator